MSTAQPIGSALPAASAGGSRALLELARQYDRRGCTTEAAAAYEAAVAMLERSPAERAQLAEALRSLAVVVQRRREMERARELCWRSHKIALEIGNRALVADALNTLGGLDLVEEHFDSATQTLHAALQVAPTEGGLRGRVEQNLGTVASMRGDTTTALGHYRRSVDAFLAAQEERGTAIAHHNLGRVHADRGEWREADVEFQQALRLAEYIGDTHLKGLCQVNRAEVLVALEQPDAARRAGEQALGIFQELGAQSEISDAYRVLAMVNYAQGRTESSLQGLQTARELAAQLGSVYGEAEALRELARLYRMVGRIPQALDALVHASELHGRAGLRFDVKAVLDGQFPALVRDWTDLIAAVHPPTHASSQRVSEDAPKVARALGLAPAEQATLRLGALFYDVGKLRVPVATLEKAGPLDDSEHEYVRTHTLVGEALLGQVRFPWDIGALIRSHHERINGGGYPDGLQGDAVQIGPQIIGLLDVYQALRSPRPRRPAMSHGDAVIELEQCRTRWHTDVYAAFRRTVAA